MNRRTLLSFVAALVYAVVGLPSGGSTLLAQPQQDTTLCEYRITYNSASPGCSSLELVSEWGTSTTLMETLDVPGNYQFPVPGSLNCPPTPSFNWVNINGSTTQVPLNTLPVQVVSGGCCVLMRAVIDPDGYIHIFVDGC